MFTIETLSKALGYKSTKKILASVKIGKKSVTLYEVIDISYERTEEERAEITAGYHTVLKGPRFCKTVKYGTYAECFEAFDKEVRNL